MHTSLDIVPLNHVSSLEHITRIKDERVAIGTNDELLHTVVMLFDISKEGTSRAVVVSVVGLSDNRNGGSHDVESRKILEAQTRSLSFMYLNEDEIRSKC
jgi:hypothetical protein